MKTIRFLHHIGNQVPGEIAECDDDIADKLINNHRAELVTDKEAERAAKAAAKKAAPKKKATPPAHESPLTTDDQPVAATVEANTPPADADS